MKLLIAIVSFWFGGVFCITFYGIRIDEQNNQLRNYQLDITDTGTHVYSRARYVGFVPFDSTAAFDKLFINDNQ